MEKIGHILSLDIAYDEDRHTLYIFLFWTEIVVQCQGLLFKSKQSMAYRIYENV